MFLAWIGRIRLWELALCVFLGFGSYLAWTEAQVSKQLGQTTQTTLIHADSVLTSFGSESQKTFDNLNRLCELGKPCGTLADINRTLAAVRGTFGQVEVAAIHENKNLSALDAQEAQLFGDTHRALGSANEAISGIVPVEKSARDEIVALNKTTTDLDSLATDSHVRAFIANLEPLSNNAVAITGTSAHMLSTADAVETHYATPILHPSHNPFIHSWQTISPFAVAGAKIAATVF